MPRLRSASDDVAEAIVLAIGGTEPPPEDRDALQPERGRLRDGGRWIAGHDGAEDRLGAVVLTHARQHARAQHRLLGRVRQVAPHPVHHGERVIHPTLVQARVGQHAVERGRRPAGHGALDQRGRLVVLPAAAEFDGQVVEGGIVRRVELQHGTVGGDDPLRVVIHRKEVEGIRQVALDLGQAVAVLVRLRGGGDPLRFRQARVAQHGGELAPRHRERAVRGHRAAQRPDGLVVAAHVGGVQALGVEAQRLERAGADLLELLGVAQALQRLADALAQSLGEAVERGQHVGRRVGGLAQRHELGAVRHRDEAREQHHAAAHGVDLARDHGLGVGARRHFPGQRARDALARLAHAGERLRHVLRTEHGDDRRLRQVDAQRLAHRRAERGVGGAVVELGHHHAILRRELARGHQRAGRPDAEIAHRGPRAGAERQRREGEDAADHRLAPGEEPRRRRLAARPIHARGHRDGALPLHACPSRA